MKYHEFIVFELFQLKLIKEQNEALSHSMDDLAVAMAEAAFDI